MTEPHEQATIAATDLAERIVEEISESAQDWHAIERHARQLVELLAWRSRLAETPGAPGDERSREGSSRRDLRQLDRADGVLVGQLRQDLAQQRPLVLLPALAVQQLQPDS